MRASQEGTGTHSATCAWRRFAVVPACLTLVVTVAACGSSGSDNASTAGGNVSGGQSSAVIGNTVDFSTLDFQVRGGTTQLAVSYPAYDRLVAYDPNKNEIVPYLATSWEVTPEDAPTQIEFTLRDDAKCSDGTPVTPTVVRDSFERWITVEKTSNALPFLFGAGPFNVSANDADGTFTFRSETPFRGLLFGMSMSPIICPKGLEAARSDPEALFKEQYGSGPYVLERRTEKVEIVWKKRADWSWGPPGTDINNLPDTLTWKLVPDATTLANLLVTGGVDMGALTGPDVERLEADPNLQSKKLLNYSPTMLIFNQRPGRIAVDEAVRKALMTAVDPEAFIDVAWQGRATRSPSFLNPDMPCFNDRVFDLAPQPSVAEAQKILESAGYSMVDGVMTKDGKELEVQLISNAATTGDGGEYVASQWREAGVDVQFQNLSPTTAWAVQMAAGDFDATTASFFLWVPEPWFQFSLYHGPLPPVGFNIPANGLKDKKYQDLGERVQQTTDCGVAEELQEYILDASIMLPLAQQEWTSFGNDKWDFPANVVHPDPIWFRPGE